MQVTKTNKNIFSIITILGTGCGHRRLHEGVRPMMMGLFLCVFLMLCYSQAQAVTQTMTACTQAAFTAAYNAASPGDTIAFPAGSCSILWGSSVNIAKTNLTIQGSGTSYTTITTSGTVFETSGTTANGLRITGIKFVNCTPCFYFNYVGTPREAIKNLRVDHCLFDSTYATLQFNGRTTGVADNNTFLNAYAFYFFGSNDVSATFPFTLGTSDSFFVEDNTLTINTNCPAHFVVANLGARYVARYNLLDYSASNGICGWKDSFDAHDRCENYPARGTFTWEIYNNKFKINSNNLNADRLIHMRGGQGVIFNNYIDLDESQSFAITLTSYERCSTGCVNQCTSYPCQDQITATYVWGNKSNCGSDLTNCIGGNSLTPFNDCQAGIQENRDYWNSPMPGYTPYTYPHPLRSPAIPSPPKNLRIIP